MTQRVLLVGSTGLIGRLVGTRLAADPNVDLVRLIRSGSAAPGHAIDFEQLRQTPGEVLRRIAPEGIDTAISCLGTTIRTAGSQEAMFVVDHDYVLAAAKGAKALGARQFILVTSTGAGGPGFYLQTKGKIEKAVMALDFERVDVIRPGFLIGSRSERRFWEDIGQRIFAFLTPMLFGPLSRYGAISAQTVAEAIVMLAGEKKPGLSIHENDALRRIARREKS